MKVLIKRILALVLAVAMVVAAAPVQTQAATSGKVTLDKTQYVLKKGGNVKLKATVKGMKGVKLTWKSSNSKVATVSSKGVVKAKAKKGTAKITATAGKKKAVCKITIGTPVKSIKASDMTLKVGGKGKIKATLNPKKVTNKTLTYKSNNTKIATVDKKGNVKGISAGTAKITITAADCNKVKKTIKVTVKSESASVSVTPQTSGVSSTPSIPAGPTAPDNKDEGKTPEEPVETPPAFSMAVEQNQVELASNEDFTPEVTFSEEVDNKNINWTSSDETIAAVISSSGKIHGLIPGTATVTGTSQKDSRVKVSIEVTISEEGTVRKTVESEEELINALTEAKELEKHTFLTLSTEEKEVVIPEGEYQNVTLIVDAPKATVTNHAVFEQILIQNIAKNTWCEMYGNSIFMDATEGHLYVDSRGNTNAFLLPKTDAITITNEGNLKNLLIASAAETMIKGDSVASRIDCNVIGGGKISTYVPLDIYSTQTYQLLVGPGGEQTALRASDDNAVPSVYGVGTLSITIDSNGTHKTLIAEGTDEVEDLAKTTVSGRIVKEGFVSDEEESTVSAEEQDQLLSNDVIDATVYLVKYSMDFSDENATVYMEKGTTKKVQADDAGNYTFTDVPVGNYVLIVEAEGYSLISQVIYIDSNYNESRGYVVDDIVLMDEGGKTGTIEGVLVDASTGAYISRGLTVYLRKGINNITSNEIAKVISGEDGYYSFEDITPGQYTIQVRDNTDEDEVYVSQYENVSVYSEARATKNFTLTKGLNTNSLRFVLTWDAMGEGVSSDLDIYLYGPNPFNDGEYDVHFNSDYYTYSGYNMEGEYLYNRARLDVDDKEYEGPETITVNQIEEGQYKIFVQDYSEGGTGNKLYTSNPVVKVYRGSALIDTIKMGKKNGGVWFVGSYDGASGRFTVADENDSGKPNTSVRAQIGTVLNQLMQFDVIDEAVFAQDQELINRVTANYLTETNQDTLQSYLDDISALLSKLKKGLTMKNIKVNGQNVYSSYDGYEEYHDLYTLRGKAESIEGAEFTVTMEDSNTSFAYERLEDKSFDYRLILSHPGLGVSTNYYFDYCQDTETEYWVKSIKDPDNTGWKTSIYNEMAYTGGDNAQIGRNLQIEYEEGVTLLSMDYQYDIAESEWSYGEYVDLVLHLVKKDKGITCDYQIRYKPLGADLLSVQDTNNTIVEQGCYNYYAWYYEGYTITYRVFGKNDELGTTWAPVVADGCMYEVSYPTPDEDGYLDSSVDAYVTVMKDNGAYTKYGIYYYKDTSSAQLVGLYDPDNMYTRYNIYDNYYTGGTSYEIDIKGLNSTLGKNLQVTTLPGASAKIEYVTGSESWEGRSSDAKITITAQDGCERVYYVVYGKSEEDLNIRGIQTVNNTLVSVYASYSTIDITGTDTGLSSDDILFKMNSGYSAKYDEETDCIIVTGEDGSTKQYDVTYTQDVSSVTAKAVTSASDSALNFDISSSWNTASGTGEKYYRIDLVGQPPVCPKDLNLEVPVGGEVNIEYAEDDTWPYGESYVAKAVVTNRNVSLIYLISYQQDDSGADVKQINCSDNKVVQSRISTQRSMYDPNTGTYDQVQCIYVLGDNAELGDYTLICPEGATYEVTNDQDDWPYSSKSDTAYMYVDGDSINCQFNYVHRVVVTAKNGAQKIYLIAYCRDTSGAAVKAFTDSENEIVNYRIETSGSSVNVGDYYGSSYEYVYYINVIGENSSLGDTFELKIKDDAQIISDIDKNDEKWEYTQTTYGYSYYDMELETYLYYNCDLERRVEVQAANGVTRVYVIAYAQNQKGCRVTDITDDSNEYMNKEISYSDSSIGYYETDEEGNKTSKWETLTMIYVFGKNASLGDNFVLETPPGATTTVINKGDAGWYDYFSEYTERSYYEGTNYYYLKYYYDKKVIVEAANGAKKTYMIAYAPDTRGTVISGITDEQNTYYYTQIDKNTTNLYYMDENNMRCKDVVKYVMVYGNNKTLGETYKLEIPEGSFVAERIRKGGDGWKSYNSTTYTDSYWDENDVYTERVYEYQERIVVEASNGTQCTYMIVYAQNKDGAKILGVTGDAILKADVQSTECDVAYYDEEGYYQYDTISYIYVRGRSASLKGKIEYELPDGCSIVEETWKGDEGWKNYNSPYSYHDYCKEDGQYVSEKYDFHCDLVVEAENGAQRRYLIAYLSDTSDIQITGITARDMDISSYEVDEEQSYSCTFKDAEGNYVSETVYYVTIDGTGALELTQNLSFTVAEGNTLVTYESSQSEDWYCSRNTIMKNVEDEDGSYSYKYYDVCGKLTVENAYGGRRMFLIGYYMNSESEKN